MEMVLPHTTPTNFPRLAMALGGADLRSAWTDETPVPTQHVPIRATLSSS